MEEDVHRKTQGNTLAEKDEEEKLECITPLINPSGC